MNTPYEALLASERSKNKVYEAVIKAIEQSAAESGITRKIIAERIGRKPSAVSLWLSGPSNWTIETVSHLLYAIDAEIEYNVVFNRDRQSQNEFVSLDGDISSHSDKYSNSQTDTTTKVVRLQQVA